MASTVLVVGGTGLLGAPVANGLRAAGYEVRLLVRDRDRARGLLGPDFTYLAGDVGDDEAVRAAVAGCVAIHVSLGGANDAAEMNRTEHHGTARVARLGAAAGVRRLSYVSGAFVGQPSATHNPYERAKMAAESAIEASGVPFTIFRPTYFMETLPRHLRGRRAIVLGRQPHPLRMIAAADFAGLVCQAISTPAAAGQRFYPKGPEPLTLTEALRTYCAAIAPRARVSVAPLPVMSTVDHLMLRGELRRTINTMRLLQRLGDVGDGTSCDSVLGPCSTTLARWCHDREQKETGPGQQS
jgi:NADH dehydrogenase